MIKIIKKTYLEEKDVVEAVEKLKNIYVLSLCNMLKAEGITKEQVQTTKEKIAMLDKVIVFVKEQKLRKLRSSYTYNLKVEEKDGKYYHALVVQSVGSGEVIQKIVSDIENI